MRDEKGMLDTQIEKELGLRQGVVARLGKKGVFEEVGGPRSVGEGALD